MRRKIRCSELARYLECSGFKDLPNILEPEQDYSLLGTSLHKQLENTIKCGGEIPEGFIDYVNFYHKLNKEGWEIDLEVSKENDYLHGTSDMVAHKLDMLIIADLKTGYIPVLPTCKQLLGYALLNLRNSTKRISCRIFQNGEWSNHTYKREEVEALKEQILNVDSKLKLGDHCQFCSRLCPLQQEAIKEVFNTTLSLATLAKNKDAIYKYINKAKKNSVDAPEGYTFINKVKKLRSINLGLVPLRLLTGQIKMGLKELDDHLKKNEMTQEEHDACVITTTQEQKQLVLDEILDSPSITLGEEL